MTKDKTFTIWIKGSRSTTEREVVADSRDWALIKAANCFGTKTFKCDAKLAPSMKIEAARLALIKAETAARKAQYAVDTAHIAWDKAAAILERANQRVTYDFGDIIA